MPATAIVTFAHGSSIESANESVRRVVEMVRRDGGFDLVEAAFLEQGKPDLAEAVASAVAQGATRVVVVPYFLTLGLHLQRDLPNSVKNLSRINKGVQIDVAPPLAGQPSLSRVLQEREREALAPRNAP